MSSSRRIDHADAAALPSVWRLETEGLDVAKKKRPTREQTTKAPTSARATIEVRVDLLEVDGAEKRPQGAAYAFSSQGRLLAKTRLGRSGEATLQLPASKTSRSVRVLAGPDLDDSSADVDQLMRLGAQEQYLRVDPGQAIAPVDLVVIPDQWLCWLFRRCYVRGVLKKRQTIGGNHVDLPVCDATVEVYEVDPLPLVIARLPDDIIGRIRDLIDNPPFPPVGPIPNPPIPLPDPPDGPFPPPPIGPFRSSAARQTSASAADGDITQLAQRSGSLGELQVAARAASLPQLRQVLVRYPDLTRFLICRFFPAGIKKTLVATGTTDDCGRFQTYFLRGCFDPDTPDLYFKAKQYWGPFPVTILCPTPVQCYTHWNYECGSEVCLYTTSPWARTCEPCTIFPPPGEDDWVAVMHIGNLPISRVRGTSVDPVIQASTNAGNTGLCFATVAESNDAAAFGGRPFGGLLRPHIVFSETLIAKGVTHYQVSWRQGTAGMFQPLDGEVHRHYSFDPPGPQPPVFAAYNLGPHMVGGKTLFEIRPNSPPSGQWVVTDLVENQTSAKFPTSSLAPAADHGTYQLKIDLFDAAGNLIDIDTLGVIYVVPEETDLSNPTTIHTVNAADPAQGLNVVVDDDGDGRKSFIMTVHVDNNVCSATVGAAQIGLTVANPCGVIEYDPANTAANVVMPFVALHPNGFGRYSFTLKRGTTPLPVQTKSGDATPPGNQQQTATVATLLSGCPIAAFSEHLHVNALAHTGWGEINAYDASDHAAFVLAPPDPPE